MPRTQAPVHANYPFMTRADIEATWPQELGPEISERARRRARRTTEDR
jgi:hypothetical protein